MSYHLRDKLYFCQFPAGTVFLDVLADRYFLLPNNAAGPFQRFLDERASREDERALINLGLIQQVVPEIPDKKQSILIASSSVIDNHLPTPLKSRTIEAIMMQMLYRHKLRRHSLDQVLSQLRLPHVTRRQYPAEAALEVAAAFQNAKRYLLATQQCMPIGLAMKHNLFRLGIDAKLIFGVTMPFSAHCWVQVGNIVLTDRLDNVLPFRPIMVV